MNLSGRIVFAILLLSGTQSLRAQQINPTIPPPPPPEETSTASAPRSPEAQPIDPTVPPLPPSADEAEEPSAPAGPVFDPLHAQRSIDIGTFYLKKGIYDAAIDRFVEAANYQPTLAMPWKLLGETYEKKHEYGKAAESYQKYLKIVPHAEDAAKIRKHISELEEKAGQEASKKAER
jgi:tetratricopeptide (TPR) repeat protein